MLNFWNNKKMSQSQLVASHKNKKEAFSMEKPVKDLIDNIAKLKERYVRYLRKYDPDTNTSPWTGLQEDDDK